MSLVLQQFSDVGVAFNFLPGVGRFLQFLSQHGAVHIAQRDQPRAFHFAESFDVIFAAAIEANHRDANVAVRADDVSGW